MIKQYLYSLKSPAGAVSPDSAYKAYAWLLNQIPEEYADAVHENSDSVLNHGIYLDRTQDRHIWKINLMNEDAARLFDEVLTEKISVTLGSSEVSAERIAVKEILSAEDIILDSVKSNAERTRTVLHFLTPTAFKQRGKYRILPDERLILQSLISRWNLCCPDYPLMDEDAFSFLENGLSIVNYRLSSARYSLKNARIPGFCGDIVIESHLPEAMEEIWQILVNFSSYCGIGIKTSLGMGSVSAEHSSGIRKT